MEDISPRQCRAARSWLGWTQRELADRAGVDQFTVKNFESEKNVRRVTALAILHILAGAGAVFDDRNNLIIPYRRESK